MIEIVKAICTCAACPSQWDAWDADGTYYYLRYRWGRGTVQIPDTGRPDYGEWKTLQDMIAFDVSKTEGPYAGLISLSEFCQLAGITLSPDCDISWKGGKAYDEPADLA